jgi:hypothetical protein
MLADWTSPDDERCDPLLEWACPPAVGCDTLVE